VLHSLSIGVFNFRRHKYNWYWHWRRFPGMSLIYFPGVIFICWQYREKIKVVEAVAAELNLNNVTTQHIRAQEIKTGIRFRSFMRWLRWKNFGTE
jgi:hypothetical protein